MDRIIERGYCTDIVPEPISSRPSRDAVPRRLIVTVSVVAFAFQDWSLWVLLRDGPWGPPMRLVLGSESVTDAVEHTLDALLMWPDKAPLLVLKAGWQEQQVQVWKSTEQGTSVSLIHSVLLRANRDELRPNLRLQSAPSLHVKWIPVAALEAGEYHLAAEALPVVFSAMHMLRSHVQREPETILHYLADMDKMRKVQSSADWWQKDTGDYHIPTSQTSRETVPLSAVREPASGDGIVTLAEASLLYRAIFPPDEQIDLTNLRRRFLATNKLEATNEERPVRGREIEWRRVSRAYRYVHG